jgi:metal-sulfur cluster biosynthetic enzyme
MTGRVQLPVRAATAADAPAPEVAALWAALRDVMDPEFPISVVDLGLVYDVRRWGDVVEVDLTFTATACPCMDFIREDVRERLLQEDGVGEVRIREVWSPPWTRERISAEGRAVLRKHGVAA